MCAFSVEVRDTTAPSSPPAPDLIEIWRPNHKYQRVNLADCVSDKFVDRFAQGALNIASAGKITRVTSDELEDDKLGGADQGDGNTCDDIVITGNTGVDLRAERLGDGTGRMYTIYFDVSDSQGNVTHSSCQRGRAPRPGQGQRVVAEGMRLLRRQRLRRLRRPRSALRQVVDGPRGGRWCSPLPRPDGRPSPIPTTTIRSSRQAQVRQVALARASSSCRSRLLRHPRRALELGARFLGAPELRQQIAAHARQQVVALQRRLVGERVDELEPGRRTERHRDRDRAVELDHRRRRQLGERVVERGDARPVGVVGGRARARDRRRSPPAARTGRARRRASRRAPAPRGRGGSSSWSQRARSCSSSRIGSPVGPDPRARSATPGSPSARPARAPRPRRGTSSARMRPRRSASSHSAGRIQSSPRRRRVALVEDEVDHLEHRRQPRGELGAARHLERHAAPRPACAWRARCAARSSARGRGTRARSRRSSGRRAGAASARRAPRSRAPDGRR